MRFNFTANARGPRDHGGKGSGTASGETGRRPGVSNTYQDPDLYYELH